MGAEQKGEHHSWPSHYSNQLLMFINNLATNTGAKPLIEHAIKLSLANGKKFMSGYLSQITDIEKLHGSLQAEILVRCPCEKCLNLNNLTPLPHLESLSASLQHPQQQQQQQQQQQVSASASLPPRHKQQQHKRKPRKKHKTQTKSLPQILPSVVQTIPLPQLIPMQQQQMFFNNHNFIPFLPQQQMYCNLLPQLPMASPVQYNTEFFVQNMRNTDDHKRKDGNQIQRIANDILVQFNVQ